MIQQWHLCEKLFSVIPAIDAGVATHSLSCAGTKNQEYPMTCYAILPQVGHKGNRRLNTLIILRTSADHLVK